MADSPIPPSIPPSKGRSRPNRESVFPKETPAADIGSTAGVGTPRGTSSPSFNPPPSFAPSSGRSSAGVSSGTRNAEQAPPSFSPSTHRRSQGKDNASVPDTSVSQQSSAPPAFAPRRRSVASTPPMTQSPQGTGGKVNASGQVFQPSPANTRPVSTVGKSKKKRGKRRPLLVALVAVLVVLIAWPAWLVFYVNSNLQRVDALVPGTNTPGTTYLLAGSDERDADSGSDVEGRRADSLMLIHTAANGQSAMVSIPRDTYVDIPGYGYNKVNAAFAFGGPQLLVETIQNFSGLAIDHYAEINMGGLSKLVDAVGGVELCLDYDVSDDDSNLRWTAGCKLSDGETALAFSRMRYQDPRGDLGRAERQRQVVSQLTKKVISPSVFLNPFNQMKLASTGTSVITVDESSNVFDIAKLLLAFKAASNSGLTGTPPLSGTADTDVGSVVLVDEAAAPDFFDRLANGSLSKADFEYIF